MLQRTASNLLQDMKRPKLAHGLYFVAGLVFQRFLLLPTLYLFIRPRVSNNLRVLPGVTTRSPLFSIPLYS